MSLAAMRYAFLRTSSTAQRATLASASTVGQRAYHENVSALS